MSIAPARPARAAFYFSAHEDDWQLFMNPAAFRDVRDAAARCVFVHVTAGDAGLGTGNGGRHHLYYLARENGARAYELGPIMGRNTIRIARGSFVRDFAATGDGLFRAAPVRVWLGLQTVEG